MTQSITASIWERWMKEYVPNLIERRKCLQDRRNFRVGDVVIVIEPCAPIGQFPLARVHEVLLVDDGVVRIVRVKMSSSEGISPVAILSLLEDSCDG